MIDIKLLARKNNVDKSSRWSADLGPMSGEVEGVCEKHSKKSCWLKEANDGDVRR